KLHCSGVGGFGARSAHQTRATTAAKKTAKVPSRRRRPERPASTRLARVSAAPVKWSIIVDSATHPPSRNRRGRPVREPTENTVITNAPRNVRTNPLLRRYISSLRRLIGAGKRNWISASLKVISARSLPNNHAPATVISAIATRTASIKRRLCVVAWGLTPEKRSLRPKIDQK